MNILEVTPQLRRGAGTVVTKLSEHLKLRGHEVVVVTSGDVDDLLEWPNLHEDLKMASIKHHYISVFKRESHLVWNAVNEMAQLLTTNNFDIVHVNAGVPAFIVKAAMKKCNKQIPVLSTFHSWGATRPEWMNIADTIALNDCDEIVYVSNEYVRIGSGFGVKQPKKVIYPFVTIDEQALQMSNVNSRFQYNIPEGAVILSHLGEITDKKGQLDLIKALPEIRKQVNAYVLLVGQCRDEEYLKQLNAFIDAYDLKEYVIITGWVDNALSLIKQSDAFVFPSYSEGLGMAIVEAALCDVPVTFSYHEGMKDIQDILGEDGFGSFELGNIEEITKQTLHILQMPTDIKKDKIKQVKSILVDAFSLEKMVSEYEVLMLEMTASKG